MNKIFDNIGKPEIRNLLAVLTVVGCFALLYILQVKPIPPENKEVLNIAIGFVFGGLLAGVAGYYFGASKSGNDKSEDGK